MYYQITAPLILSLLLFGTGIPPTQAHPLATDLVVQAPRRAHRQQMLEQLNLTKEQEQQISQIRQKNRPQMQKIREEMRDKQTELQNLLSGNSSESELRQKHQKITELRQEMANLHFENMLEIRQVLTPSQRSQFVQLMQQRRQQRGNFGRGSGPDLVPPEDF